jgi:cation:H+ antiporter
MWYEILLYVLLLALGFVLLSKGADVFVDGSASVATKAGIPQLVIGLTIVAMGTSAPEAAVSISSSIAGSAEIAVGNVVGSNILNVLIILGLSATIVPLAVRKISLVLDIPMVLLATVVLFVLGLFGSINFIGGIILLLIFIGYMAILFINAKKPKKPGELEEEDAPIKVMPVWKSIIFIVLGLGMIVLGSDVTVDSATALARIFGVSERFIALTIVALGTSLPELFTSVNAAIKGNADIAVGNVLGSCIFNILFILGLTSLIIPVPFESKFLIDTIVAFVAVLLILLFSLKSKKLARWAGIVMLVAYAGYFVYLLLV